MVVGPALLGLLALLAILALPALLANIGTPLMWANILHLVVGNAVIGLVEGLLLAWIFRQRAARAVGWMIAANYVSAWVGMIVVNRVGPPDGLDLTNAWRAYWTLVAAAYAFTLLVEFPFVALALRRCRRWLVAAIAGSLLVQTVSYAALFGWYGLATDDSLYRQAEIVSASALPLPEGVVVYFLADEGGAVHALRAGGIEVVRGPPAGAEIDDLRLRPSLTRPMSWSVDAMVGDRRIASTGGSYTDEQVGTWFVTGERPDRNREAPSLSRNLAPGSSWSIGVKRPAATRVSATRRDTGERLDIGFETFFVSWTFTRAVLLPGDRIVFQLGSDQICLLDLSTRRIALLAKGRAPVAVLER